MHLRRPPSAAGALRAPLKSRCKESIQITQITFSPELWIIHLYYLEVRERQLYNTLYHIQCTIPYNALYHTIHYTIQYTIPYNTLYNTIHYIIQYTIQYNTLYHIINIIICTIHIITVYNIKREMSGSTRIHWDNDQWLNIKALYLSSNTYFIYWGWDGHVLCI